MRDLRRLAMFAVLLNIWLVTVLRATVNVCRHVTSVISLVIRLLNADSTSELF